MENVCLVVLCFHLPPPFLLFYFFFLLFFFSCLFLAFPAVSFLQGHCIKERGCLISIKVYTCTIGNVLMSMKRLDIDAKVFDDWQHVYWSQGCRGFHHSTLVFERGGGVLELGRRWFMGGRWDLGDEWTGKGLKNQGRQREELCRTSQDAVSLCLVFSFFVVCSFSCYSTRFSLPLSFIRIYSTKGLVKWKGRGIGVQGGLLVLALTGSSFILSSLYFSILFYPGARKYSSTLWFYSLLWNLLLVMLVV